MQTLSSFYRVLAKLKQFLSSFGQVQNFNQRFWRASSSLGILFQVWQKK